MPREWYQTEGTVGSMESLEPVSRSAQDQSWEPAMPAAGDWWRPQVAEAPSVDRRLSSEQSGSSVPFWSLMVFTCILLFSPQQYFPALAPLRPALLAAGAGILAYVLDRMARRLPIFEWTWELKLVAALVGWATLTVPFSVWPGGSLSVVLDQFAKTVAVFVLLSHVVTTSERLRQVAWILTGIAVGLGCLTAYNYATGTTFLQGLDQDRVVGTEGGLTKNPNDLALMINLILPLSVGLLIRTSDALQRKLLIAAIGVEMVTVVLSYSRGGALTLGVILMIFAWKLRRRSERKWLYGLFFAGLMALPLAPSSYLDRLSTIANIQADRTGSAQERWSDMTVAVKTIISNPIIGAGIGMNTLAMKEARGGWLPVHNVYLEHGLDLGLPGLVLFVLLLWSCHKATVQAQRVCRSCDRHDVAALAEGLQVSLLAYATAAMFHPVSYHMYFYYMAGLALAAWKICSTMSRPPKEVAA